MGIKINVQTRNDYSYLFNSMNQKNGLANSNFLSDYSSIKNGSYGKLMKAYYSNSNISDELKGMAKNKVAAVSKDDSATLTKVQKGASDLKASVDKLSANGKDSVYESEDEEAAYKAVSQFVGQYNSLVRTGEGAFSSSINSRTQMMESTTNVSVKNLAKIGITVNMDKSLSIDKDAFMKASTEDVQKLFSGSNSFGSRVASQADFVAKAAENEAAKANTYSAGGVYANAYNTGNLFNSKF